MADQSVAEWARGTLLHIKATADGKTAEWVNSQLGILDEHAPIEDDIRCIYDDEALACDACGGFACVPWPCRTVRLIAWGLRFHAPGYPGPEEMP